MLIGMGILCLVLGAFIYLQREDNPVVITLVSLCSVAVASLFFFIVKAQKDSHVSIADTSLELKVPLYSRSISLGSIDRGNIEIVECLSASGYSPTWKTNGLWVPGYRIGWFRSRSRGKVLTAVTTDTVVAVPTDSGFTLLVSAEDPASLCQFLVEGA